MKAGNENPTRLATRQSELALLTEVIQRQAVSGRKLEILEAGCGPKWLLDLYGVDYRLTGLDINEKALEIRKKIIRDLDEAIVGDLRNVKLEDGFYDVIYSSFVLKHISDAHKVLENFRKWLKPGGLLILRILDGDSVYGFLTKNTPFWVHLFYKKYVKRISTAGKPGHGPFPTVHESVVSVKGMRNHCKVHSWNILEEYGSNYNLEGVGIFRVPIFLLIYFIHILSFGCLAARHNNLVYLMQSPESYLHA
jgi:SAM-dependent methyltransferase